MAAPPTAANTKASRSSSGVEQRIRNAWAGGSNPSCGTNKIKGLGVNLRHPDTPLIAAFCSKRYQ
jgi:hypothetical protein